MISTKARGLMTLISVIDYLEGELVCLEASEATLDNISSLKTGVLETLRHEVSEVDDPSKATH